MGEYCTVQMRPNWGNRVWQAYPPYFNGGGQQPRALSVLRKPEIAELSLT
jgi:hypothetical protein